MYHFALNDAIKKINVAREWYADAHKNDLNDWAIEYFEIAISILERLQELEVNENGKV